VAARRGNTVESRIAFGVRGGVHSVSAIARPEVKLDGEELIIMKESDIRGVIVHDAATTKTS